MTNTSPSRRISSAMASRKASRTVVGTSLASAGISGAAAAAASTGTGPSDSVLAMEAGFSPPSSTSEAPSPVPGLIAAACEGSGGAAPLLAGTAERSSPSSVITAIGVLTATFSVPSGTRIRASVPSSTASTSIVALSVSISAMTSPERTASPSFLSHLASVPCSIVGDSAGMRMFVAMVAFEA